MKKYLLFFLLLVIPSVSFAQNIPELIATTANKYHVDPGLALFISYKESKWKPTALGDHKNSRGLWQISRIYHPEVSDKVAFDPVLSTQWAMKKMSKDGCNEWSTCPIHGD